MAEGAHGGTGDCVTMKFLGTLFLFAGYTLIYSAVANGGRFASDPWNSVLSDAYSQPGTSSTPGSTGSASAAGATPSPVAGVTISKGRNRQITVSGPGTVTLPQTPGTPFGGFRS